MTLAIGPEGGWIPYEVDLLQASGLNPVQLGARILRVGNRRDRPARPVVLELRCI